MQDARDDAIVGIRLTAVLFGDNAMLGVGLFYVAAALALAAILIAGGGPITLAGWLAYAAHLAWQALRVEGADPATALRLFRSNATHSLLRSSSALLCVLCASALSFSF